MRKYGLPQRKPKKKAVNIDKRPVQTSCDFCSYKIKKVSNFKENSPNLIQDTINVNLERKTNDEVHENDVDELLTDILTDDHTDIDNFLEEDHTAIDNIIKEDNTGINGDLKEDLTVVDDIFEEDNTGINSVINENHTAIDDIFEEDNTGINGVIKENYTAIDDIFEEDNSGYDDILNDLTVIDDILKNDHTIVNDILDEDITVINNIKQDLFEIRKMDKVEEHVPIELDCIIQPTPIMENKKHIVNKKKYLKSIKKYFKPHPPAPKRILFECGVGNGFTFATNNNGTSMTQSGMCFRPKTIASVAIDSTILEKPKAKIEFSSNIHFVRRDSCNSATAEVEFELIRLSKNKVKSSLDTWLYCISNGASNIAETFSFLYCDCNTCPEGCHYFVIVTPIQLENVNLSIVNCHISAIAQSRCDSH